MSQEAAVLMIRKHMFGGALAVIAATFVPHAAIGQSKSVTCTGMLIDVDIDARADFPMAVVYDADERRACVLDRGGAGHDPLKGYCSVSEKCRLSGSYFKKIGQTYYMRDSWKAETPK
jgi:hypothetical protein